jgi:prepilin-type N-terminal cleavage/methylation domain-containing protein
MPSRKGGFSLVELLVVIAILAVLIGILLPAVRAARLASKRTVCASRLHELTAACVQYQLDHRQFPHPDSTAIMGEVIPHMIGYPLLNALAPYLNHRELPETAGLGDLPPVAQCPFAEDFDQPNIRGPIPLPGGPFVNIGYQYTVGLDELRNAHGVVLRPGHVASVRGNRRGVVWSDEVGWYAGSGVPFLPPGDASYAYLHVASGFAYNGVGLSDTAPLLGQHRAWSDGSVEWVKAAEMDLAPADEGPNSSGPSYKLSFGPMASTYAWF